MEDGTGKEQEKKKANEDLVMFMRKRSDNEAPRYTARLKTYVDIQRKRRRAAVARRQSDVSEKNHKQKDPNTEKEENKSDHPGSDEDGTRSKTGWFGRRPNREDNGKDRKPRSKSRTPSDDDPNERGIVQAKDQAGKRRSWGDSAIKEFLRVMCRRRRRRRSCRRRRRRRSCRRRRRSRRRRRRSCRRRRRRCGRRRRRRRC